MNEKPGNPYLLGFVLGSINGIALTLAAMAIWRWI